VLSRTLPYFQSPTITVTIVDQVPVPYHVDNQLMSELRYCADDSVNIFMLHPSYRTRCSRCSSRNCGRNPKIAYINKSI